MYNILFRIGILRTPANDNILSRSMIVDVERTDTTASGFVLAGGQSRRMGRDKAMLPAGGRTLVEHVANEVRRAAGSVTIVGDPSRYGRLGYEVIPDEQPGLGPLGGIATALGISRTAWNLVVACDMPSVDAELLITLLARAAATHPAPDCVVPDGPTGPEPLCAVYHIGARGKIRAAIDRNILKMRTVITILNTASVNVPDGNKFRNINTPEDWAAHE